MRVLLISDVHGNLPALETVLRQSRGVDAIWNLGDTVGYGARPNECLKTLIDAGCKPFLAGNHDLAAIGKIGVDNFNPVAAAAVKWTASMLIVEHREYLRGCPSTTVAESVTLAHGSPRDPVSEYVLDARTARDNLPYYDTPCCLVGHTHVAAVGSVNTTTGVIEFGLLGDGDIVDFGEGKTLVNPGSVGQPRDGDPRAAYALVDTSAGSIRMCRAPYDIALAQRQIIEAGLPKRLADRLSYGL